MPWSKYRHPELPVRSLKLFVLQLVALLSLICSNECAGTTCIYTHTEMPSGNHAHVCILADMHIQAMITVHFHLLPQVL